MKVKMKNKGSLPNCWKSCGASYEDWQELQSGKEIEVSSVSESVKNLVLIKSPSKKGDK